MIRYFWIFSLFFISSFSFSQNSQKLSVAYCKTIFKTKQVPNAYAQCGNYYDINDNILEAFSFYNKGLDYYPNNSNLKYHKAIALANNKETKKALLVFEDLIVSDSDNPDIHNSIGRVTYTKYRIPSLMAMLKSMILTYGDTKYNSNIKYISELFNRTENISILQNQRIYNSSNFIKDKRIDNYNFKEVEHFLNQKIPKINTTLSEVEQMELRLELLGKAISKSKVNKKGFFWEYYGVYFENMIDKDLTLVTAHIILSTKNKESVQWLENHQELLYEFRKWDECTIDAIIE